MEVIAGHIINVIKFLVMLGILIFVHELGHFLVARRAGVYIKKFFLGFDIAGLKLLSFKKGETEYGIGILPLGGYVKMAGQEDLPVGDEEAEKKLEEEDKDIPPEMRFDRKPLSSRAAIVAAGPLMNLLLGLILFIVIAFIGVSISKHWSQCVVGSVEPGLPAAEVGIRPGDRIVEVGGEEIEDWDDLLWFMRFADPGEAIPITYRRDGEIIASDITPRLFRGSSFPRIGISPGGEVAVWGLQTDSEAFRAGLAAGDIVEAVNGRPVLYPQVEDIIGSSPGADLRLTVVRTGEEGEEEISVPIGSRGLIPGLYVFEGRVLGVDYRARDGVSKLKKGDRIVGINGRSVSPEEVNRLIEEAGAETLLELDVLRKGWMFFRPDSRFSVRAEVVREGELEGVALNYYPEKVLIKYSGLKAVSMGVKMTKEMVEKMFVTVYMLAAGRLPASELAGPVGIFAITSTTRRLIEFITLLALISINLGIINLLPLPVLDGGHLLLFLIEGVRRKPLTPRTVGIAQHVGLILIIALFILVTYNDIIHRLLGY